MWTKSTNEDEVEAIVRFVDRAIASHTASDVAIPEKSDPHHRDQGRHHLELERRVGPHQRRARPNRRDHGEVREERRTRVLRNVHEHLFKGEQLVIA